MKKNLLLLTFMLSAVICSAQFDLKNYDDDTIVNDGQTLYFADSGCGYDDSCNWRFKVTNTSTQDIYIKIFVDEIVNSDGSNVQLCFSGTCLNSVARGNSYPSTAATIAAGTSTGVGNYFWNQHPSGTTTEMSWTLRFQELDAPNGVEIGTPISVTYNFDPSLSIDDSELTAVEVFPTQVKDELNISSNEELTAQFYDILGKRVKQITVASGESTINVSDLSPQLYIIRFTNKTGKTLVKKIVVE